MANIWVVKLSGDPIVLPPVPLAASSLTALAISSSQIDLSWVDNASNEDGYRVERSPDGVGGWVEVAVGYGVNTYSDVSLMASKLYYYRVIAFNTGGAAPASNIASDMTSAAVLVQDPPTSLVATAFDDDQIDLSWTDNSISETGFKIERSPDGTTGWAEIATVGANVSVYSSTGLDPETTYHYRARAYNANGNSAYSNIDSDTTLAESSLISAAITADFKVAGPYSSGWTITRSGGFGVFNGTDFVDQATDALTFEYVWGSGTSTIYGAPVMKTWTNLVKDNCAFSTAGANWTGSNNLTIDTADDADDLFGDQIADRAEHTGQTYIRAYQQMSIAADTQVCFGVMASPNTGSEKLQIGMGETGYSNSIRVNSDLAAETISLTPGDVDADDGALIDFGGSPKRLLAWAATNDNPPMDGSEKFFVGPRYYVSASEAYDVNLANAFVHDGSYPRHPTVTTSSTKTINPTVINLTSMTAIDTVQGVFAFAFRPGEWQVRDGVDGDTIFWVGTDTNNYIALRIKTSSGRKVYVEVKQGGTVRSSEVLSAALVAETLYKAVIKYDETAKDVTFWLGAAEVTAQTALTTFPSMSTATALYLGHDPHTAAREMDGWHDYFSAYMGDVDDADCADLADGTIDLGDDVDGTGGASTYANGYPKPNRRWLLSYEVFIPDA